MGEQITTAELASSIAEQVDQRIAAIAKDAGELFAKGQHDGELIVKAAQIADVTKHLKRPLGAAASRGAAKPIQPTVIKHRLDELVRLHQRAGEARDDLAEAIAATAEASGLRPAVVRKYVAGRARDKLVDMQKDCEQLSLLLEDLGTFATGLL